MSPADLKERGQSLPIRIKIKTCRLPKDFFGGAHTPQVKLRSFSLSRHSNKNDADSHPQTPSFGRMPR